MEGELWYIALIPVIGVLVRGFFGKEKRKDIGRLMSKLLRTRLGRTVENWIETWLQDILDGAREDNLVQIAKQNLKEKNKKEVIKEVEALKKKSPFN